MQNPALSALADRHLINHNLSGGGDYAGRGGGGQHGDFANL